MNLYSLIQYVKYFFKAKNEHSIHAPFLYNFYLDVIKKPQKKSEFSAIENFRSQLLSDPTFIEAFDQGAGSKVHPQSTLVKTMAQGSISDKKQCRMLYQLVKKINANTIVEIGSSFGVSTSYMAIANKNSKVYGFEGNISVLNYAKRLIDNLQIQNVVWFHGNFDVTLPLFIENLSDKIDFVFIDGNHKFEPTYRYFELIAPHLGEDAIVMIDDIYWSEEMTKVWNKLRVHPSVSISVDLYAYGLLFMSPKYSKEHFRLNF